MGEVTGRYSNFLEESGLGRVRVCYQVEWQYIAALDMKSQSHIEKLAEQKLASAYCLLDKGQYNDAYYLARIKGKKVIIRNILNYCRNRCLPK